MSDPPRFCGSCGKNLSTKFVDGRERPVCGSCGTVVYRNPLPCVAAVIVRESKLLLVQRKVEPGVGEWGLPAGFMEWGEAPEAALVREIEEETGLKTSAMNLLTVCSEIIDPYGHVLILGYAVDALPGEPVAGDDASDARFFELDSMPPLAFKTHREIWRAYKTLMGIHP